MKFMLTFAISIFFHFSPSAQIIPEFLHQKWMEVASQGPKVGDTIFHFDTARYKINFEFLNNGTFFLSDSRNKMNGIWKWNEDTTKIGMHQLKVNDRVYDDKPITEYPMLILKLTKDSLIIGLQGSHGISREFYRLKNN